MASETDGRMPWLWPSSQWAHTGPCQAGCSCAASRFTPPLGIPQDKPNELATWVGHVEHAAGCLVCERIHNSCEQIIAKLLRKNAKLKKKLRAVPDE